MRGTIEKWLRPQRAAQRDFNPYVAGKVVPREMFFGREDLVRRILSTIHNNCVFLHGERRRHPACRRGQVEDSRLAGDVRATKRLYRP
jgi:hypothetical protein